MQTGIGRVVRVLAIAAAALAALGGQARAATFTVGCGDVSGLANAVTSANGTAAADTIEVSGAPCTFSLTAPAVTGSNNNNTGLPTVVNPLTINGHGATIARSGSALVPFRIIAASGGSGALTLNELTISGGLLNGGNAGAGVLVFAAPVTLDRVTLSQNATSGGNAQGGGVYVAAGSLVADHSTFFANQAVSGAGLSVSQFANTASTATVRRSLFLFNAASSSTGAALVTGSTATFENDTVSANAAANSIGGLAVINSGALSGTATVTSSTFADNGTLGTTAAGSSLWTGVGSGGGTATINVEDTIVTDSDSTAQLTYKPCDKSLGGTIANIGGSLEWPGNTCGFGTVANPQLGALAANGGPTPTYKPGTASPAIDLGGGSCPATDQRDVARPDGDGCDAGAFETPAPETTISGPASDPTDDPTVTFASPDTPDATFQCRVDNGAFSTCASPYSPNLSEGQHTIRVRAVDPGGYVDPSPAASTFMVAFPPKTFDVACGDAGALRAAIAAANATKAHDTIEVTGGPCSFTLSDSVDAASGGNGLPIVVHPLTVNGHGATIERDASAPTFRIFFVSGAGDPAAKLTLNDLTLLRGSLAGNNTGSAVASFLGGVELEHVTLNGNTAPSGSGGAIGMLGGSLQIDHSQLLFNTAFNGGAIALTQTPATVRRSLLVLNGASGSTGAALIAGGEATFENDTITTNVAGNGIGGIAAFTNTSVATVVNVASSTFVDNGRTNNSAPGGALWAGSTTSASATIHVADTTVTDPSTAAATFNACTTAAGGTITDDGGNLEWPHQTCGFGTHADPQLAALADNGGPTFTYRPLPASPAIELGGATCPATDQRDVTRPDGDVCDSGAFETPAPETEATGPSPDPTNHPEIAFASPDTPDAAFQCRVDGGAFSACSSPYAPVLGDGQHTVDVRAVDGAGYADPSPASVTFTVDATPPDTTITSGPSGTIYNQTSATFTFTSSKPSSTFECRLDQAPFAPCTSPHTVSGYAVGTHTFAVRAIDIAGVPDPTPATRTFTYQHCSVLKIYTNILGQQVVICL